MNEQYATFKYMITNRDGLFYRGTAYGDGRDWTDEKREWCDGAYHYTLDGAWKKICTFPLMFAECEVVRD